MFDARQQENSKTQGNLQEFLLSSQRDVAQRIPGLVQGERADQGGAQEDLSPLPIKPSLCTAWQHYASLPRSPALGKEAGIEFAEPGVGLGREDPELSHTVGLIQPWAQNSSQTGNFQDATWNSLQGEEEWRGALSLSSFSITDPPPSSC